jgi:hypothetical protein
MTLREIAIAVDELAAEHRAELVQLVSDGVEQELRHISRALTDEGAALFPARALSVAGKALRLAALHDAICADAQVLNPWANLAEHDDAIHERVRAAGVGDGDPLTLETALPFAPGMKLAVVFAYILKQAQSVAAIARAADAVVFARILEQAQSVAAIARAADEERCRTAAAWLDALRDALGAASTTGNGERRSDELTLTEVGDEYDIPKPAISKACALSPDAPGYLRDRRLGRTVLIRRDDAVHFGKNYNARREARALNSVFSTGACENSSDSVRRRKARG